MENSTFSSFLVNHCKVCIKVVMLDMFAQRPFRITFALKFSPVKVTRNFCTVAHLFVCGRRAGKICFEICANCKQTNTSTIPHTIYSACRRNQPKLGNIPRHSSSSCALLIKVSQGRNKHKKNFFLSISCTSQYYTV